MRIVANYMDGYMQDDRNFNWSFKIEELIYGQMKPSPMLVVDPDKQEISKGKIIIVDL